jgi:hypothetical protein
MEPHEEEPRIEQVTDINLLLCVSLIRIIWAIYHDCNHSFYYPMVDLLFLRWFMRCKLLIVIDILVDVHVTHFMNCDNQNVIIKVNSSKGNMKSSRHVKRRLKSIKKWGTRELFHWIISKHLKTCQISSKGSIT